MKPFVHILVLIMCISFTTYAQKDSRAKTILDRAYSTFEKSGDHSINFTIRMKHLKTGRTDSYGGILQLKGNKYNLRTSDSEIWYDGRTQWAYVKSSKEVNVSTPEARDAKAINLSETLGLYKKNCNYKYIGSKRDFKGRKVYEVELYPQRSEITKASIFLNSSDYMPVYINALLRNGTQNTVYVNKYQAHLRHADSNFIFNKGKYPGVEIIDLR